MRSPMTFDGKQQSYLKTLEARIMALEAIVSAMSWTVRSERFGQCMEASMRWHEEFIADPASRVPPEFARDWRASLLHVLTHLEQKTDPSPDTIPGESDDPQARSTG